MAVQTVQTIKIFFCYAQEDDDLRKQLAAHLSYLRRLRYITGWFDRDIQAGTDWEHEIESRLDAASIILLLISADFIASDYCYTVEMQRALEKQKAGTAHVIPILLRPAMWEDPPLGELQALPTGKKPITQWANQDEAWLNVAQGIRELVKTLLSRQHLSSLETMILNSDVLDLLGQPPIVTPPPLPSPRETRVLPPGPLNQPGQSPSVPPTPFSPTTQQYKQPLMPSTIHKPALSNQSQRPTRASIPWLSLRVVAIVIVVVVLTVVSTRTILNLLIVQTPASMLSPTASASPSIGQTPASTRSPTASASSPSSAQTIPEDMTLICNANCGANIVVTLSSITVGGLLDPTWNFTAKDNDTVKCGLVFSTPYLLDKDTGNNTQGLQNGTRLGTEQEVSPGGSISLRVSFPGSPSKGTFAFSSNLTADCGTLFSGSRSYQTVTIKLA